MAYPLHPATPEIRSVTDALNFVKLVADVAGGPSGSPGLVASSSGTGVWLYRGHGDAAWCLVPDMFRQSRIVWAQYEQDILASFRQRAIALVERVPRSDMQWLALMRHHGAPSRLLDWSTKPLVALWFACASDQRLPARLIRGRAERTVSHEQFNLPFEKGAFAADNDPNYEGKRRGQLTAVVPEDSHARIAAQGSVLTIHEFPELFASFTPLEDYNWDWGTNQMQTAVIPASFKRAILQELHDLGVHRYALFPDLTGLGQYFHDLHDNSLGATMTSANA